jgi:hypothetical protein
MGRMNTDKNNLKIGEDQFNLCHQCSINTVCKSVMNEFAIFVKK